MPLGDRVRELRKEHDWSQADLGTRIGTDSQRISRYENGKLTPAIPALIRLAEALNVTVDYLIIDGAPANHSPPTTTNSPTACTNSANSTHDDRNAILHNLDGLKAKNRVRNATPKRKLTSSFPTCLHAEQEQWEEGHQAYRQR